MSEPGEYRADCTEGITRVEDLPQALRVERSRNYARRPCPECGRSCYRNRTVERTLHDLGDLVRERPRDVLLTSTVIVSSNRFCRAAFDAVEMSPFPRTSGRCGPLRYAATRS